MKIGDILRHKGTDVVTIAPDALVRELVDRLAEHNVGALVVLADKEVVGIVSERDVVRRLTDTDDLLERPVESIMTSVVHTTTAEASVDAVAETMTERRIRHLPIVDDNGRLVGVISVGDVVSSRIRQLEQDRGQLEHYITG